MKILIGLLILISTTIAWAKEIESNQCDKRITVALVKSFIERTSEIDLTKMDVTSDDFKKFEQEYYSKFKDKSSFSPIDSDEFGIATLIAPSNKFGSRSYDLKALLNEDMKIVSSIGKGVDQKIEVRRRLFEDKQCYDEYLGKYKDILKKMARGIQETNSVAEDFYMTAFKQKQYGIENAKSNYQYMRQMYLNYLASNPTLLDSYLDFVYQPSNLKQFFDKEGDLLDNENKPQKTPCYLAAKAVTSVAQLIRSSKGFDSNSLTDEIYAKEKNHTLTEESCDALAKDRIAKLFAVSHKKGEFYDCRWRPKPGQKDVALDDRELWPDKKLDKNNKASCFGNANCILTNDAGQEVRCSVSSILCSENNCSDASKCANNQLTDFKAEVEIKSSPAPNRSNSSGTVQ